MRRRSTESVTRPLKACKLVEEARERCGLVDLAWRRAPRHG
jgi:hypothetical protein